jgi:hypothetical protein
VKHAVGVQGVGVQEVGVQGVGVQGVSGYCVAAVKTVEM